MPTKASSALHVCQRNFKMQLNLYGPSLAKIELFVNALQTCVYVEENIKHFQRVEMRLLSTYWLLFWKQSSLKMMPSWSSDYGTLTKFSSNTNPKWLLSCVFKFLQCSMDRKHLIRFWSANATFKFLQHSLDRVLWKQILWTKINQ